MLHPMLSLPPLPALLQTHRIPLVPPQLTPLLLLLIPPPLPAAAALLTLTVRFPRLPLGHQLPVAVSGQQR